MNDYVDTRGAHPLYVRGCIAVQLRGKPLDISVEDAREIGTDLINATSTPVIIRIDS